MRRQHLLELDERPHRRLVDACRRGARRGSQADSDLDRLLSSSSSGSIAVPARSR
jgi:hypothetical protein